MDDLHFAEMIIEGTTTYTCTVCGATKSEDTTSTGQLTLSLDSNHQLQVAFDKSGFYTNYGLYCYDSNGGQVGYTAIYDGFSDASVVLPMATSSGTYSLVVKGWGDDVPASEVARLDNCIQVAVDGEALAYTMAFDGENQPQTATVTGDTSSGVSMLYGWNGTASGAGSVSATVTANRTLQEGDIFHLRLITAYAVTDNVVQVTMTPSSTQTYA
ncbi:MAG TPA: hypothetical protein H9790_07395 [Candidatus Agathobaculum intestinipullorum]|nr:hypothetical protein [Candidatus Agathobaculum intestinipullorum]